MGEANRRAKAQGYKSAEERRDDLDSAGRELPQLSREELADREKRRSDRAGISISPASTAEVHARRVDWAAGTTAMLHKRAVSPLQWIK